MADYFGFQIPDDVMEDVLFRFLYNIPENEVFETIIFQYLQAFLEV